MPTPTWRVGAYAERYPGPARDVGRAHKAELVAARMLYEGAGVMNPSAMTDACYGGVQACAPGEMARGCCGSPCSGGDSCCDRGTCCNCGPGEDDFSAVYPDAQAALEEGHALSAAIRDILTDPDLEDVGSAIDQAVSMAGKGQLAALYGPQVPAKKMPSGDPAPARCPICGATVCPTCECCCACVPSQHEMPAAADAAEM